MPIFPSENRSRKWKITGIAVILLVVVLVIIVLRHSGSAEVYVEFSFVEHNPAISDTEGSGGSRGTIFARESDYILIRAPWSAIGFEDIASSDKIWIFKSKPELKSYLLRVRFPSPEVGIRVVQSIGISERGEDVVLCISSEGLGRGDYGITNDTERPAISITYDADDLHDIADAVRNHTGQEVSVHD